MCLDVVRISRIDAQLRPAVCLTEVNCNQQDAELSVAHSAQHDHQHPSMLNLRQTYREPGLILLTGKHTDRQTE